MLSRISLVLMFFMLSAVAYAQRSISGTVTDEGGAPLSNVSYVIVGTNTGGVTGDDGNLLSR